MQRMSRCDPIVRNPLSARGEGARRLPRRSASRSIANKSVVSAAYLHVRLPRLPMSEETMRRTRLPEKMRRLDSEVAFSAHALSQGQRAGWPHPQIGGFAKR